MPVVEKLAHERGTVWDSAAWRCNINDALRHNSRPCVKGTSSNGIRCCKPSTHLVICDVDRRTAQRSAPNRGKH